MTRNTHEKLLRGKGKVLRKMGNMILFWLKKKPTKKYLIHVTNM